MNKTILKTIQDCDTIGDMDAISYLNKVLTEIGNGGKFVPEGVIANIRQLFANDRHRNTIAINKIVKTIRKNNIMIKKGEYTCISMLNILEKTAEIIPEKLDADSDVTAICNMYDSLHVDLISALNHLDPCMDLGKLDPTKLNIGPFDTVKEMFGFYTSLDVAPIISRVNNIGDKIIEMCKQDISYNNDLLDVEYSDMKLSEAFNNITLVHNLMRIIESTAKITADHEEIDSIRAKRANEARETIIALLTRDQMTLQLERPKNENGFYVKDVITQKMLKRIYTAMTRIKSDNEYKIERVRGFLYTLDKSLAYTKDIRDSAFVNKYIYGNYDDMTNIETACMFYQGALKKILNNIDYNDIGNIINVPDSIFEIHKNVAMQNALSFSVNRYEDSAPMLLRAIRRIKEAYKNNQ